MQEKKKDKLNERAFRVGAKLIGCVYPESSWRNQYLRLRWWLICSDQCQTKLMPWFDTLLQGFEGKLWNRGKLIRFDYWLCWIFLGAEPDDYFDGLYNKSWLRRRRYVTTQRLDFCNSVFNKEESEHFIGNKLELYQRWHSFLMRKWCIPQNVSFEEFQSCFAGISRILIKPASLYGGKGIYTLELDSTNIEQVYTNLHCLQENIIAEEYVSQKGYLHDINPSSLNTLRVITIWIEKEPEVCFAALRTGRSGSIVDNVSSGGLHFPIQVSTGILQTGHGQYGKKYRSHPDTGLEVTGHCVPDWEKVKEFACQAHRLAPTELHYIGWDICWSNGDLFLIEGNTFPGLSEPERHENHWKVLKHYLDCFFQTK